MKKQKSPGVTFRQIKGFIVTDNPDEIIRERDRKLDVLCDYYGIPRNKDKYYELSLRLAAELYPEKKTKGVKSKWTETIQGVLVVEVERMIDEKKNSTTSISWACDQLAKKEPWLSFISQHENNTDTKNSSKTLRQYYYKARHNYWTKLMKQRYLEFKEFGKWSLYVDEIVNNRISF